MVSPRRGVVVAAGVWGLAWGTALTAVALRLVLDLPTQPLPVFLSPAPPEIRNSAATVDVAVAMVYGPVSALIIARRPHPVGVLLAVLSVGSGVAALGIQYGLVDATVRALPLADVLALAAGWAFVPGTFAMAVLPLLVRHDPLPRAHRAIVLLCLASAGVATAASLTQQPANGPANPLAVDDARYQDLLVPTYSAASAVALLLALVTCGVVARRAARAAAYRRAGLWWLAIGHLFLTLSYIAMATPEGARPPTWLVAFALLAPVIGQVVYPAAILVVVLGQRLWGIELLVSRVLLWLLLSASGVATYLLLIAAVSVVLPSDRDLLWLLVPFALAVAAKPLNDWLQRRIDALVYGAGADPVAWLSALEQRLGDVEDGEVGLEELCVGLRRSLRLGYVGVRDAGGVPLASSGVLGPASMELLLHGAGRPLGDLVVGPLGGQRFDARTVRTLRATTGFVAAAWLLADTHRTLGSARDALMVVRAEERRRLRRDLHDTLGPALAGSGFALAAVENLLATDPASARELLAEVVGDVRRDARVLRTLAAATMPSPMPDGDLAAALADLARRWDSGRVRVLAHADLPAPVPVPIAETAFLVAAEAVTNAVRHASATTVRVTAVADRWTLRLEVCDDGRGIAADSTEGIGMNSMRERVSLVGRELDVATGPRGTRVAATLPTAPGTRDPGPETGVASRGVMTEARG